MQAITNAAELLREFDARFIGGRNGSGYYYVSEDWLARLRQFLANEGKPSARASTPVQ